MPDHGRLIWCASEGEGQSRLSLAWVRDADRIEHLDMLRDWIADLEAKYDACLLRMPNWHAKTWADRGDIDREIAVKQEAENAQPPAAS